MASAHQDNDGGGAAHMSLSSDFSGAEGTLAFLIRQSSDNIPNPDSYDYNVFRVYGKYSTGAGLLQVTAPGTNDTDNNYIKFSRVADGTTTTILASPSTDWTLFALTWSQSTGSGLMQLYRNGSKISIDSDASAIGAWPATAYTVFEADSGPGEFSLAHVAVWKAALPSSDISDIWGIIDAPTKVGVTAEIGGTETKLAFVNPTPFTVFVTTLQVRGKRIKQYRPVVSEQSDPATFDIYGEAPLEIDMAYQDDPLVGQSASEFLLEKLKTPTTLIETITFTADRSDALMTAFLDLEPGDRVTIVEQQTSVSADFFINGCAYQMIGDNRVECTWYVTPAQDSGYWALGVAGFSELGETTVLSY